ncbi:MULTISPECIES: alginate export family protein [unclassified Lentimonas]|uniref:alginate export family protein n=1 Tax=unclassified Lentimonas TaxID=2630993 RepID=UPI001323CFD3|nr:MULTISPECIES: alginate export family protein [unclassified Lentimonas]CAA6678461.1 Unannotated [Lentimonas sp. CC4]CAA6685554.1 Unannotated [Lentimonas sp. CC6]CAA7077001.1 Unannotated [Lentimonas sp. CC4]CAA7170552.1 Unannotated [Lentimonas sp. CC21]CAA7180717.1 Unannotated [Lentimonas sp. CC8]
MKNTYTKSLITVLALAGSASFASAESAEAFLDEQFKSLEETIPGKFNVTSRTRYEVFNLNTKPDNHRNGFSESIRYGYTTETFGGFNAMVEGETVTRIGGDHDDIHPLDDAGDGTDFNQYWLGYQNEDYGKAKIGRQIYILDDSRFIGNVGWRQNMQTFDAATGSFTMVENLTVNGFYMDNVNRVNADNTKMDTAGANIKYKVADWLSLTGFYYHIKSSDIDAFSNDTTGIRATGKYKLDEVTLNYAFSYAHQEDNSQSPTDIDADYWAGDLSAAYEAFTFGAGFEVLGDGFRTPLATVHKFNGYADVFLPVTGIDGGLQDLYAYVGYKIPVWDKKSIPVKLVYHSFDSDTHPSHGNDYGDEIDFVASYKVNKYTTLMAKYGYYMADDEFAGAGGADKTMFTFDVNFSY